MAETSKPSNGGDNYRIDLIAILFFVSVIFGYFYRRFTIFIADRGLDLSFSSILDYVNEITTPIRFFSVSLSILFLAGAVFLSLKTGGLAKKGSKSTHKEDVGDTEEEIVQIVNKKWERVVTHLESQNPSDWKLSILEADIILGEMLEKIGYKGETIGEKLKGIEKSDFETVDLAWQAHKIRNDVAHKGYDYTISKEEAIRIIEMYKKVFEEFHFI